METYWTRATIPPGHDSNLNWLAVARFEDRATAVALARVFSSSNACTHHGVAIDLSAVRIVTIRCWNIVDIHLLQSIGSRSSFRKRSESNHSYHVSATRRLAILVQGDGCDVNRRVQLHHHEVIVYGVVAVKGVRFFQLDAPLLALLVLWCKKSFARSPDTNRSLAIRKAMSSCQDDIWRRKAIRLINLYPGIPTADTQASSEETYLPG